MSGSENNDREPGSSKWLNTVFALLGLLLGLAKVWKPLEKAVNSWLTVPPELLIVATILFGLYVNRRSAFRRLRSSTKACFRYLAIVTGALHLWFEMHASPTSLIRAKSRRETSERIAEDLKFEDAIRALNEALQLLESAEKISIVTKELAICRQTVSALNDLDECWNRLRLCGAQEDHERQLAIICNMCASGLPGGRHEHLSLYKICCAKILCELIDHVIAVDPPASGKKWIPASTATGYLGRLAADTDQRMKLWPDEKVLRIVNEAFGRWERRTPECWLFTQSFEGARKLLRNADFKLN